MDTLKRLTRKKEKKRNNTKKLKKLCFYREKTWLTMKDISRGIKGRFVSCKKLWSTVVRIYTV